MFKNSSTESVRPERKADGKREWGAGRYFCPCWLEMGIVRVVTSRSGAAGLSHIGGILPPHINFQEIPG
jgi:hypothetical protein